MRRADLPRAYEAEQRIDAIDEALSRSLQGVFKEAALIVRGVAHGTEGIDGRRQNAETMIPLDVEFLRDLLQTMRRQASSELARLGIED